MNETLHIYTRVSTAVQEEQGTSLENQKALGIKKSEELGLLHKVWDEGGQSSFHDDLGNRPALVELLTEIENNNVQHLFVYNTDRLSRNQKTWGMIRYKLLESGVTLHTVSGKMELKNPIDDLLLGILSEISQYDNKLRTERSRQGRFEKVKMGFWRGGPTPFGYKNENKKLVIDVKESKWIKEIYRWYSKGISINEIRTKLNLNGVLTRRKNTSWSLGSIRKILGNKTYVGHYEYTDTSIGQTLTVPTPPIIDQIMFNNVQKRRRGQSKNKQRNNSTKHFYLLTNLMVCGDCGTQISGRINRKSQQNYYYCPKTERNWAKAGNINKLYRKCSTTRSLNIAKTDELVWDTVLDVVEHSYFLKEKFRDDLIPVTIENRKNDQFTSKKILAKTKRIQKELSDLNSVISLFETDVLLKRQLGDIEQIRNNLNDEQQKLVSKIHDVKTEHQAFMMESSWVDWISVFKADIKSKDNMSEIERKEYLSKLVNKIKVTYDHTNNNHKVEVVFKVPIVNDKLVYNNPDKRSDGWKIKHGGKSKFLSQKLVGTRGKTSKKNE